MELRNLPNTCTIVVEYVGDTVPPADGKTFKKRSIGVIITDKVNGTSYSRKATLQCTGNTDKPQYDKTGLLDNIMPGMFVNIDFTIRGNVKMNEKLAKTAQNPGQLEGFNNLDLTAITIVGNPDQMQQPQYGGYPAQQGYQQPGGYQQPQYAPQPGFQPQTNYQPAATNNATAPATGGAPAKIPRPTGPAPKDGKGEDMVWNEMTGSWEDMPF